jgi:hypothetical protein
VGVTDRDLVTPLANRSGCATVDYDGNEMNVGIRIGKSDARLTALVRVEDASGTSPQRFELSLSGWTEHQAIDFYYRLKSDGTLNAINPVLNAGRGKLTSVADSSFPPDYYVASVRQGDRDVLLNGLYFPPNTDSPLEIVVSAAGAMLRGKVMDSNGKPTPFADVVLVPQGLLAARSDRANTYRTAKTDQNGIYEIRGLIPGQYRAHAVLSLDGFAFWDPAFTKSFDGISKRVQIEKNSRISADLTLINPTTP